MKRQTPVLLLSALGLVVAISVFLSLKFGLQPKPHGEINPSEFTSLDQIGDSIFRRLHLEIQSYPLVLLGSRPQLSHPERVWKGLIHTGHRHRWKITAYFHVEGLEPLSDQSQALKNSDLKVETLRQILAPYLAEEGSIVIHVPQTESSQLRHDSLAFHLRKKLKNPVLSFSQAPLFLSRAELPPHAPPCDSTTPSAVSWDCASIRFSQRFFQKDKDPHLLWAGMERLGRSDHVVFIHEGVDTKSP